MSTLDGHRPRPRPGPLRQVRAVRPVAALPASGPGTQPSLRAVEGGRRFESRSEDRRRKLRGVIERDGERCVWCGAWLSHDDPRATLDHVIPHSLWGTWSIDNLLLSCRDCNEARGNTSAELWLDALEHFGADCDRELAEQAIRRAEESAYARSPGQGQRPPRQTDRRRRFRERLAVAA